MGMSDWSSDVCSSELPRSAAAFGIFAIMLKRVGELRDGSGADQASGDAFADQTFAARGLGRDDRQVASHRLQRHIAECFSNRGIEQDIHRRNGTAQIRAHLKSRKDAGGEAILEPLPRWSVAYDQNAMPPTAGGQPVNTVGKDIQSLLHDETTDETDDWLVIGNAP